MGYGGELFLADPFTVDKFISRKDAKEQNEIVGTFCTFAPLREMA